MKSEYFKYAVPWLAAAGVLLVGALSWPYTVDDAFIVASYARNLWQHGSYGINPGQHSDGVTGPLWLLPFLLGEALGLDSVALGKIAGLLCSAAAAWLVVVRMRARSGGRLSGALSGLLLVTSPSLGTWGVGGLQTGAATLLLTIAWLAATERPGPRAVTLGTAIGALAWLRPEMAPVAAWLLWVVLMRRRSAGLRALGLAAALAALLLLLRLSFFDALLPLSYAAKGGSLGHGLRYVLTSTLLLSTGVGLGVCVLGAIAGGRDGPVLGVALLVHLLAVALAGGDWMPGYRLLVPVLPLYAVLCAGGLVRLWRRRGRFGPAFSLGLLSISLAAPLLDLATRPEELRKAAESQRVHGEALAVWLREHAGTVALVDIGYLGYRSGVRVVDLGALTDPELAAAPGGHLDKRVSAAWLRARGPDTLVLHSARPPRVGPGGELLELDGYPVERRVAAMAWVRREFRVVEVVPYAPGYHYLVMRISSAASESQ
ncbi:MAG: hypothetical protein OEZ06_18545 [Myxococcales bacterium]|nr:hypothetical protein [Myxococcales bacterium]